MLTKTFLREIYKVQIIDLRFNFPYSLDNDTKSFNQFLNDNKCNFLFNINQN